MATTHEPTVPRHHGGGPAGGQRTEPHDSSHVGNSLLKAIYSRQFHVVDRLTMSLEQMELRELAALGDEAGVRNRLSEGSPPGVLDCDGWTPLHHAAALGHVQVVDALLDGGAHVNQRSSTPRSYEGSTALHLAVAGGHAAVVESLLARGANPSLRDDAGYAAMHLAAELGHLGIVKRLVRAGARLNPLAGDETPLGLAVRQRRMQIAAILRQCGGTT